MPSTATPSESSTQWKVSRVLSWAKLSWNNPRFGKEKAGARTDIQSTARREDLLNTLPKSPPGNARKPTHSPTHLQYHHTEKEAKASQLSGAKELIRDYLRPAAPRHRRQPEVFFKEPSVRRPSGSAISAPGRALVPSRPRLPMRNVVPIQPLPSISQRSSLRAQSLPPGQGKLQRNPLPHRPSPGNLLPSVPASPGQVGSERTGQLVPLYAHSSFRPSPSTQITPRQGPITKRSLPEAPLPVLRIKTPHSVIPGTLAIPAPLGFWDHLTGAWSAESSHVGRRTHPSQQERAQVQSSSSRSVTQPQCPRNFSSSHSYKSSRHSLPSITEDIESSDPEPLVSPPASTVSSMRKGPPRPSIPRIWTTAVTPVTGVVAHRTSPISPLSAPAILVDGNGEERSTKTPSRYRRPNTSTLISTRQPSNTSLRSGNSSAKRASVEDLAGADLKRERKDSGHEAAALIAGAASEANKITTRGGSIDDTDYGSVHVSNAVSLVMEDGCLYPNHNPLTLLLSQASSLSTLASVERASLLSQATPLTAAASSPRPGLEIANDLHPKSCMCQPCSIQRLRRRLKSCCVAERLTILKELYDRLHKQHDTSPNLTVGTHDHYAFILQFHALSIANHRLTDEPASSVLDEDRQFHGFMAGLMRLEQAGKREEAELLNRGDAGCGRMEDMVKGKDVRPRMTGRTRTV